MTPHASPWRPKRPLDNGWEVSAPKPRMTRWRLRGGRGCPTRRPPVATRSSDVSSP
jgi:hypothetical protein